MVLVTKDGDALLLLVKVSEVERSLLAFLEIKIQMCFIVISIKFTMKNVTFEFITIRITACDILILVFRNMYLIWSNS